MLEDLDKYPRSWMKDSHMLKRVDKHMLKLASRVSVDWIASTGPIVLFTKKQVNSLEECQNYARLCAKLNAKKPKHSSRSWASLFGRYAWYNYTIWMNEELEEAKLSREVAQE